MKRALKLLILVPFIVPALVLAYAVCVVMDIVSFDDKEEIQESK